MILLCSNFHPDHQRETHPFLLSQSKALFTAGLVMSKYDDIALLRLSKFFIVSFNQNIRNQTLKMEKI